MTAFSIDLSSIQEGLRTMFDHETPANACPSCHQLVDQATGDCLPQVNDISMCPHCFAILRFNADLTLRLSSDDDSVVANALAEHAMRIAKGISKSQGSSSLGGEYYWIEPPLR